MSKTRRNKYELPVEQFGSAGQRRARKEEAKRLALLNTNARSIDDVIQEERYPNEAQSEVSQ